MAINSDTVAPTAAFIENASASAAFAMAQNPGLLPDFPERCVGSLMNLCFEDKAVQLDLGKETAEIGALTPDAIEAALSEVKNQGRT